MLTRLDETLRHQTSATFDQVAGNDPRFFDRYWFCVYDPSGRLLLVTGMGLYSNADVLDGFAAVQTPDNHRQHNLRVSRTLRPAIDHTEVGPLAIQVDQPFRRLHLTLTPGAHPLSFDLSWEAFTPAVEEEPYLRSRNGRIVEDYRRYNQIGRANGWIAVEGRSTDVQNWWAARDHSWGVRPGMVVSEPETDPPDTTQDDRGYVAVWLLFSTVDLSGFVQLRELGGVRTRLGGALQRPGHADGASLALTDAVLEVTCYPGTRRFSRATLRLTTADGERWNVEAAPLHRSWSMDGTGYDGGFDDGRGLGAPRGDRHLEVDVYDLSHIDDVVRSDGTVRRPRQRETPVRVSVDGAEGTGHLVIMTRGRLPHYGID